jgi:hypothetical protein
MRKYVVSLLCAAMGGMAWAGDAPCPPPACPPPCPAPVCVAVPATRTIDKVIYDDRCVAYCLPRCSLFSFLWHGTCGCAECGQPRTRHVLIKKIVHEECPDVKCEVRQAP